MSMEPTGPKQGQAAFDDLYAKALMRKKLFKEYLNRHGVMERLNQAIEALYECDVLPEEPLEFLAAHIKLPQPSRPRSATSTGAFRLTSAGKAQSPPRK